MLLGTEKFSDDEQHDAILLAGQQIHKSECNIFDSGASQNVERDRCSKFIVYFALENPIPMKQDEGALYATGVGIVMYNFKRNEGSSVYSEPQALRCIRPLASNACPSSTRPLSKTLALGTWRLLSSARPILVSQSGAPNPVPMVLSDAPDDFRSIPMFSHSGSNSSLVPVYSEETAIAKNFERWSFTTGTRYDERSAITSLLTKLADDGRYAKYHPNMMLSMFYSMPKVHPAGAAPSSGVEESKFENVDEPSAEEQLKTVV